MKRSIHLLLGLVLLACLAGVGQVSAQTEAADPLQCWWRTSAGGVRIGEPFSLVLTCAVVATEGVTVVPDQAPLEPTVIQLPPFEVVGGTRQTDLRTDDRRFFQYEYRLRIISPDLFGRDVKLPDTKLTYRIQTKVGEGPAIEGRELTYFLPPLSVRVLSLVPADATDIRDATDETFSSVDTRLFRASILRTIGGVLFALAGLVLLLALARFVRRHRKAGATVDPHIPDVTVLRRVGRELASIQREREGAGWTEALAGRLSTALRIVGSYALDRPVGQVVAAPGSAALDESNAHGQLEIRGRSFSRKKAIVSASVTPQTIADARGRLAKVQSAWATRRAGLLEQMEGALTRVTSARYGREGVPDEGALDEALQTGRRIARQLAPRYTWLARKLAAIRGSVSGTGQQAWSR